jgi:hypothetical protein
MKIDADTQDARPRLANRFRAGIGLEPGDSAIVSLATNGAAADAMAAARIKGSARAGRLRLSFHVSTSDQDADLASAPGALAGQAIRRARQAASTGPASRSSHPGDIIL